MIGISAIKPADLAHWCTEIRFVSREKFKYQGYAIHRTTGKAVKEGCYAQLTDAVLATNDLTHMLERNHPTAKAYSKIKMLGKKLVRIHIVPNTKEQYIKDCMERLHANL